jgi:hypothetical protein
MDGLDTMDEMKGPGIVDADVRRRTLWREAPLGNIVPPRYLGGHDKPSP